jgi:hypothetical protein
LKLQISNHKYQTIPNGRNSKIQTMSHFGGLAIEYWNLRFICNLVLGICDFRHKTPGQSHDFLALLVRLGFFMNEIWEVSCQIHQKQSLLLPGKWQSTTIIIPM